MSQYPSDPRLLPDGSGVVCDQCGQSWSPAKGEKPDCAPCAAAWAAIEAPKNATPGWVHDEGGGYIFRVRPSRFNPQKFYGEAKRKTQPFVSEGGGMGEPFDHDLWFAFGPSVEAVLRDLKSDLFN